LTDKDVEKPDNAVTYNMIDVQKMNATSPFQEYLVSNGNQSTAQPSP